MSFAAQSPIASASYAQRIAFVSEIASRLHTYGTTAQRLEGMIVALSRQLGLDCEPWSNPTGIILSFSDPTQPIGTSDITRVIRLEPGENDLHKLCLADAVADRVAAGQMSIAEGLTELRMLDRQVNRHSQILRVAAYGMAVAGVAGLWRLPWLDVMTASGIGILIGLLSQYTDRLHAAKEAKEGFAAFLSGCVASVVGAMIGPLNFNSVIVASLVVLLPGMALTNAINELATQHWVSGTARLAGAVIAIVKLTVGAVMAVVLLRFLGVHPLMYVNHPLSDWPEWGWLLLAAFAFAVLCKANRRDYPWAMSAAIIGYSVAQSVGYAWGSAAGSFVSAVVITAGGNLFGRLAQKPGALIRVPGIILLVPGSTSLRGFLDVVQQHNFDVGQSAFFAVSSLLIALVAGLLFGNLLMPARKVL